MTFGWMIFFIVLIVILWFVEKAFHESRIEKKINSMGGVVLNIEKKVFGHGPFFFVGKGQDVYRIEYRIDDTYQEGWVKFGSIFGPDWRL